MRHALIDNHSAGRARYFLRKMLSRTDASEYRRGYRAGRLSVPHLHRVITGEQNLFQRRTEANGTNSYVTLAIDASSSMVAAGRDWPAARLACTLSSALSGCIGVKHDVLAWTNIERHAYGYKTVTISEPSKEYEEQRVTISNDDVADAAFGGGGTRFTVNYACLTYLKTDRDTTGHLCKVLEHHRQVFYGGCTPAFSSLYAAIRQVRERRGFGRKFVLFLTDGDIRDSGEREAMVRLCQEAEREGIYAIGIGVQVDPRFSIEACFPAGAAINVMQLSDLGGKAMQKLVQRIEKLAA